MNINRERRDRPRLRRGRRMLRELLRGYAVERPVQPRFREPEAGP